MSRLRTAVLALAATLAFPIACDKGSKEDPAQEAKKTASAIEEAAGRLRNNKVDDAEGIITTVLEKHPDNADALAVLGKVRYQQSNYDEAESKLTQALKAKGDDAELHAMLGHVHVAKKQPAPAAEAFGKAFQLDAENSEYGLYYGINLLESGDAAGAAKVLAEVAELDPGSLTPSGTGVHTYWADALREQGKLDEALRTYMKAQNQYGSDKMAFAGAAFVYEEKDDAKHALDQWSAYIQRDCCSEYSKTVAQKKIMELGGGSGEAAAKADPGEAADSPKTAEG